MARFFIRYGRFIAAIVFVLLCVSLGSQYECESQQDANDITCKNFSDWHFISRGLGYIFTFDSNWFIVILTGVIAALAYKQWKVFQQQAELLKKSVDDARISSERQLRAYVGPHDRPTITAIEINSAIREGKVKLVNY